MPIGMVYRPTPRQLEYIVALDDVRHFGRAARRCHVSQPTLSVQVGLMEESLGCLLFERTPNGVNTTPLGSEIVSRARIALTVLDDIVAVAAKDSLNIGGLIRLGTAPTFGPYFLPAFLPPLHRRFPELKVHIREESPAQVEAQVRNGSLDCGLGPEPEETGLHFYRIGAEKVFLGVPAEHSLARNSSIALKDLDGERLLALGSGHRLMDNVRQLARASNAELVSDYEATSLDSIRQMVSIGMGCSLFPELYARSEFKNADDVKLFLIDDWSVKRNVGFYWRTSSGRASHFKSLAEEGLRAAETLRISAAWANGGADL
jgi:LysR family hydrogen peroxide-inducible transcriptional activator